MAIVLHAARSMRVTTGFVCLLFAACGPQPRSHPIPIDGDSGSGGYWFDSAVATPCRHVDLVIAVDNSASMRQEKDDLRDVAFPALANALLNIAGGIDDFRVGVVDGCNTPANFHTNGLINGVSGRCNFVGGEPWMESSSPNLVAEFKCVGDVDSSDMLCTGENDDEQPASAAATALEPLWSGPGKPNEGFLRSNALLVVVAITDEDEDPVPGASAQEVYDRLVAIKGDVNKMVFVGIGGNQVCDGLYGHAREAMKLRRITQNFIDAGRGVFWDICQGNIEQGLTQALTTIESACEDFGPIL